VVKRNDQIHRPREPYLGCCRDLDYDGPNGTSSRRRRPRKRRGYELATKREFEKYRSEWLGRIPGDVKSRFR
jgi:hypothetical protein